MLFINFFQQLNNLSWYMTQFSPILPSVVLDEFQPNSSKFPSGKSPRFLTAKWTLDKHNSDYF